jgi:hypothetical protein
MKEMCQNEDDDAADEAEDTVDEVVLSPFHHCLTL